MSRPLVRGGGCGNASGSGLLEPAQLWRSVEADVDLR